MNHPKKIFNIYQMLWRDVASTNPIFTEFLGSGKILFGISIVSCDCSKQTHWFIQCVTLQGVSPPNDKSLYKPMSYSYILLINPRLPSSVCQAIIEEL